MKNHHAGASESLMRQSAQHARRTHYAAAVEPQIDTILLDEEHKLAMVGGQLLKLSLPECALVALFGQQRGAVLTTERLLAHVRSVGSTPPLEAKAIVLLATRLRKRFAAAGMGNWLTTVWGRGYVSTCHVRLTRLTPPADDAGGLVQSPIESSDGAKPEIGQNTSVGSAVAKRFAEATRQAIQQAHARGLAVPVRQDGTAMELRPDGT